MTAPVVATGDGALGFWAATREQACWVHQLANVLDQLYPRLQSRAKRALHEMMYAESRADCEAARTRFVAEYQAKYPKAVESLTAHRERLVSFFDFPAEHWKHLRTTNVIESPFAAVRLRERATRGAGSRTKGVMATLETISHLRNIFQTLVRIHTRFCKDFTVHCPFYFPGIIHEKTNPNINWPKTTPEPTRSGAKRLPHGDLAPRSRPTAFKLST